MEKYYYSTTDTVYSTWSDSDLKQWLVERGIIKSDAQVTREKMVKMVEYVSPTSVFVFLRQTFLTPSFRLGITTSRPKTLSGPPGPTTRFATGSLNMGTCAPMPR